MVATDSTTSSVSHTLSAASLSTLPPTSLPLLKTLVENPHDFLSPTGATEDANAAVLRDAALQLVKRFLDPLLEDRGRGKRRKVDQGLDKVYVDGFDETQVWEQVKGVVEEVAGEEEKKIVSFEDETSEEELNGSEVDDDDDEEEEEEEEGEGSDIEMQDGELEDEDEELAFGSEDEEMVDDEGEVTMDGEEGEEDEEEEEEEEDYEDSEDEAPELVKDKFGLNDGFFSIDDFNRQTELMELQDSRGNAPVDDDDEEDDIDVHADPSTWGEEDDEEDDEEEQLKKSLKKVNLKGKKSKKDEDSEHDDFDAMSEDSDDDGALDLEHENANDIRYEDFFAPPAQKKSSKKKQRRPRPSEQLDLDPEEEKSHIEHEMQRVRRDLFADDSEPEDSDSDDDIDEAGRAKAADPLSRKSRYEKQRAVVIDQIRALEAAAVAKREWTMTGEASAKARPLNSLLEEDLDFERAGKPVPVITTEVTEGIEDMIKRRILAAQFDEVLKRRPDEIKFRRGRIELDDAKPQQSLAEVYEKEVMTKQTTANGVPQEEKDEKTLKEEEEIKKMWGEVSRSLDALTNWHYTPKPPSAQINIVTDAPAISMEEAQPTGSNTAVSMLAPQELYRVGENGGKAMKPIGGGDGREIVGKDGIVRSTNEMTKEEKMRRRRREKEKIKKQNMAEGKNRGEVKEGSKKDVMDTLKKGKVTVIGKDGLRKGLDGGEVKDKGRQGKGASGLKL